MSILLVLDSYMRPVAGPITHFTFFERKIWAFYGACVCVCARARVCGIICC